MRRERREQRSISLGGREVRYSVVVSPTARATRIRVGPAGVEVILPATAPADRAASFLSERAGWVLDQINRVESMGELRRTRTSEQPGTVLLGGERIPLAITATDTNRHFVTVQRHDNRLCVRVPQGVKVDVGRAVQQWMRREARWVIEARVGVWAKAMKRRPNRLFIRGQRTKWGNCSRLGNLSFNWRLVMAPLGSLDAIVIHEMAHLIEPTHKTRFWLVVRSHCPDYANRIRWLTVHSQELIAPLLGLE